MKVFIAADHGGFKLKEYIRRHLMAEGCEVEDLGAHEYVDEDDYPDYVVPLAKELYENPYSLGVLICRNGVGVNIAANRYKHIRAALSWDPNHIISAKNDDHANVLTLPADYINEETAKNIVNAWLNTNYSNEEKHLRRLKKIDQL